MLIILCRWEKGGHVEAHEITNVLSMGNQMLQFGLADYKRANQCMAKWGDISIGVSVCSLI